MVSVVLEPARPGSARLSIEVDSLAGAVECDAALAERFERIITGLARQLRSTLEHDPAAGRYAVRIAVARPLGQAELFRPAASLPARARIPS